MNERQKPQVNKSCTMARFWPCNKDIPSGSKCSLLKMEYNKKKIITKSPVNRVWELDFARGTAVFLMILFHGVFDLAVYFDVGIDYLNGFWYYVGRFSAILFIYISGISSAFSKNSAKRGLVVMACALIVTMVSIPTMKTYYIRFGILHFFGTVMILKGILGFFIKDRKKINLVATCVIPLSVVIDRICAKIYTDIPFLFPFGIITNNFVSYDYYPIFPWLAIFAAGVLTGGTIYKDKTSIKILHGRNGCKASAILAPVRFLCLLGRNSLLIYMVHQPALLLVLYVLFNLLLPF